MPANVKTHIIRIGNSQGVRIPKPLLEQSGIEGEVEIEAQAEQLVIRRVRKERSPRAGWEEQFRAMAERGDVQIPGWTDRALTEWDSTEWEW